MARCCIRPFEVFENTVSRPGRETHGSCRDRGVEQDEGVIDLVAMQQAARAAKEQLDRSRATASPVSVPAPAAFSVDTARSSRKPLGLRHRLRAQLYVSRAKRFHGSVALYWGGGGQLI